MCEQDICENITHAALCAHARCGSRCPVSHAGAHGGAHGGAWRCMQVPVSVVKMHQSRTSPHAAMAHGRVPRPHAIARTSPLVRYTRHPPLTRCAASPIVKTRLAASFLYRSSCFGSRSNGCVRSLWREGLGRPPPCRNTTKILLMAGVLLPLR